MAKDAYNYQALEDLGEYMDLGSRAFTLPVLCSDHIGLLYIYIHIYRDRSTGLWFWI